MSTARTLIEAARRAGTLDQLAEEARAAALLKTDKKIENAQTLHLLVELARGQGGSVAADIEGRAAELVRGKTRRNPPTSRQRARRPCAGVRTQGEQLAFSGDRLSARLRGACRRQPRP